MTGEEKVLYLSNVASVSVADGTVSPLEARAIERIRHKIGATKEELNKALTAVAEGHHHVTPVGRLSDKVRNLEDMIYVSLSDGDFSRAEKPGVLTFAKAKKITQEQLTEILSESKGRIKTQQESMRCDSCGREIPSLSKFCPRCGNKIEG